MFLSFVKHGPNLSPFSFCQLLSNFPIGILYGYGMEFVWKLTIFQTWKKYMLSKQIFLLLKSTVYCISVNISTTIDGGVQGPN